MAQNVHFCGSSQMEAKLWVPDPNCIPHGRVEPARRHHGVHGHCEVLSALGFPFWEAVHLLGSDGGGTNTEIRASHLC